MAELINVAMLSGEERTRKEIDFGGGYPVVYAVTN